MNLSSLFYSCSVCFGDPKSLQSRGLFFGVCLLLGVIVFVLGAVAMTAVTWAQRAKKLEKQGL